MNEWMKEMRWQTAGWLAWWVSVSMKEWVDEQTNIWTSGWIERSVNECRRGMLRACQLPQCDNAMTFYHFDIFIFPKVIPGLINWSRQILTKKWQIFINKIVFANPLAITNFSKVTTLYPLINFSWPFSSGSSFWLLRTKSYGVTILIQIKAAEQYFPVVLFSMLYKRVLTFESVDVILWCDHSNESYWAVFSCGTV